jgi:hypothetical protein
MEPSLVNTIEGFIMKYLMIAVLAVWATSVSASESNKMAKWCVENTADWNAAASCHAEYRQGVRAEQYAELRDFLKHNPRYRVPGQSLNRCWGKPREMPFESAGIETNGNSMKAWVNYKDTLPAGCYENAPWDNRDAKK